jgi:autotransporter-associated beta strand protein
MTTLRRHRLILNLFLVALMSLWQIGQPILAANINWTAGSTANFDWQTPANWSGGVPTINDDVFFGTPVPNPGMLTNPQVISLNATSAARSLAIWDNYFFNSGALTLGAGGLFVDLSHELTLNSPLLGSAGLLKIGGGAVRLGNASNAYLGTTTIANGSLIITDPAQLGVDTSDIVITINNPVPGSVAVRGYGGGSLVLDGSASGMNLTRGLSLQGSGPIGDRGAALLSFGNNTLSGAINAAVPITSTAGFNTRLTSANGTLSITGSLNVNGTAGTTVTSLGGLNTAGANFYNFTGALSGTGTLEKGGAGTLFFNPSSTANFNGVLRVGGSAASGQSSIRITTPGVLGNRVATGTTSVLDFNTGTLEVRMDAPDVRVNNGTGANVYFRAASFLFVDKAIGSNAINGTAAFGQAAFEDNLTTTFVSRNGYGMSFAAAPVVGSTAGDNQSTFAINTAGLVTFTGNFWSNANNTGNRVLTFSGNGNSLLNGNLIASAAAFDHSLVKSGAGSMTITGTGSTLDGAVSINGGALVITDFRSVTNNTSVINIGTSTTAGALIIGTNVAATAAGLTTNKVINLAGTTGAPSIYANQAGNSPVVFNANFTATGGSSSNAKTLTLGGTNKADNIINGSIPNNAASGSVSLLKTGAGTWVLAGANQYTGTSTLSNGTLKIKANAAASTVLLATNTVLFDANNVFAGATLEFVGQAGEDNVQTLGVLTTTAGANTLKLTPGNLGTASLVITSAGAVGDPASLNIVGSSATNKVTFANAAAGLLTRVFMDGDDFANVSGGLLRKPIYGDGLGGAGSDLGFFTSSTQLKATDTNQITGSFATNTITIDALKILGSNTLTLNADQTLTIRTGAGGTDGVILATGGSSWITGGTAITTGGSGSLSIRVDGKSDVLTLDTPMASGTTGGLTKSGEGTLILTRANAQTGTVTLNEGTIQLSGVDSTLGGVNLAVTVRQGAILDLNGVSPLTPVNAWNNNGTLTNSSTTAVTFTIGGTSGTGTSFGSFNQTDGVINVTKTGTGVMSWLGSSNYTGVTTIGGTALVTVESLANIGSDSSIGRGDINNNAASLVFNGTAATSGLVFAGNIRNGILVLGSQSMTTDRLFTLSGSGVTLSSAPATNTNNAIVWSNPGAIVHGTNADRTIIFTGTSQGDNTFNPQITDSTGFATTVTKTGTGIWRLDNIANTYSGPTTITQGILMAVNGQGLSPNSNLVFDGGTLYSQGSFHRKIGTGPGEMQFATPAANTAQFSGGFLGGDSKLTVTWEGAPVWGSTPGFLDNRNGLILNGSQARAQGATGSIALSEVELASDFSLGTANAGTVDLTGVVTASNTTVTVASTAGLVVGQTISASNIPAGSYITSINSATQITISANATNSVGAPGGTATGVANTLRPIRVDDNTNTGADFATLSGIISGSAGTGIRKLGTGTLRLTGQNTYDGETNVSQGTLVVTTLGSSGPGTSSVGTTVNADQNSNAVTLGNTGIGGAILQYIGQGEVSNRKIRLNSTTGGNQIHSDGMGPLILTNVANDMVEGAKTLSLRGTNAQGNMITSKLSNNGGNLSITVDGSAAWILTNGANDYSGNTNSNAGSLGIGHDSALGSSTLVLNNGGLFAYGGDRTITNTVNHLNNTTQGYLGEYSLTFASGLTAQASANNITTNNNIVAGKQLTFNGINFTALTTTNRSWIVDGSGTTVVNGSINVVGDVAVTAGAAISKTGRGTLVLNGSASNFNRNNAVVDVDNGILRFGVSNAIASTAGYGGITLSPELLGADVATLDLNGTSQTITALTAITDGSAIIDNTSVNAASFTFGANDTVVNFGTGIGTYAIQNSGGGALSIYKAGNTAAVFSAGMTLTHTGITGVTGGSFTIASPLNGSSGFSVTGAGSMLSLTGGITAPGAVTSVLVADGGTLNLLDGTGSHLANLSSLTLGSSGGTMTTLGLNVGDGNVAGDKLNTDLLTLLSGGSLNLFAGNKVTLNLTDAGLNPGQVYDLLNFSTTGSGFTNGALSVADWILGATPGGFDSISLTAENDRIYITTGNLITGDLYWRGGTDMKWNGALNNWTTDKAGTISGVTTPGQGTNVIFVSDAVSGSIVTTLEQNFKIKSLTFEANTVPVSTPASVTINPGGVATSRLEIAPSAEADGINLSAGGPATVIIGTQVKLGANQTWTVADAASTLTVSGALLGNGNLTKAGAGRLVLGAVADPTYAVAKVTINGGTLEMSALGALGSTTNTNVSELFVNNGIFYYNNTVATTALAPVPNDITLKGGKLSAGGNNHFYGGLINVIEDSFITLRDNNSATLAATARNITLTNVVSGAGKLTISGTEAVTTNLNQVTGVLTLNNNNNLWTGGLEMRSGTVTATHVKALGSGDILGSQFGRIIFNTPGNTTFDLTQDITVNGPGAILELSADASGTPLADMIVNLTGVITIGSASNANNALRLSQNSDNFSILNISNSIVLANNASISYQGSSVRALDITAVISETGGARNLSLNDELGVWGVTSQAIRLSGANTFTGNVHINEGRLEFSTATNAGGAASNLGQGSTISVGAAATLSFIGGTSQTTDRTINMLGSAGVLSANGTGGATITYAGPINTTALPASGTIVLSGTGIGNITGGIIMNGAGGAGLGSADLSPNGGTWNFSGTPSVLTDDFINTGASVVINLNSTGVITWGATDTSTSPNFYLRAGATANLGANDAISFRSNATLLIGDVSGTAAINTLNMGIYNLSVPTLALGGVADVYEGVITGTGTLTAATTFTLSRGSISANLAGAGTLTKTGLGAVTLSGDNSGLTGTGSTTISAGNLILDYTTSNALKLRAGGALTMTGGTLTIEGNASAMTEQTVASYAPSSGANIININPGSGQEAKLNLGAITRAASAGTVRFNFSTGATATTTTANGPHGLLGLSGYATVKDASGTWFATNTSGTGLGNIGKLESMPMNDVSTWTATSHVTDEATGFTGLVSSNIINSLRFSTASAADVNIGPAGFLGIASGGILVTDQVTGGSAGIRGGTLSAGVSEIIVTHDGSQPFTISSEIRGGHALTKTGAGLMVLSGNNTFGGQFQLKQGTVQLVGGNAIGDTVLVTLADDRNSTLQLMANETIGRLAGGSGTTGLATLATVDLDIFNLTVNQTATSTFSGNFVGSGQIIKSGASTFTIGGVSSLTGSLVVNQGQVTLSGNVSQFTAISNIVISGPGSALQMNNDQTTAVNNRINNTASITLNNTAGGNGLYYVRSGGTTVGTEVVGQLTLGAGHNTIMADGTAASRIGTISFTDAVPLVRNNLSTLLVVGRGLGDTAVTQRGNITFSVDPGGAIGGVGAADSTTINIYPYAIGETTAAAPVGTTNFGNSFVRYVSAAVGFKPLTMGEYVTNQTAFGALGAGLLTNNVRFTETTATLASDTTGINSLVMDSAVGITVTGPAQGLQILSGAILSAGAGANVMTGYTAITSGGISTPYYLYVTNPAGSLTLNSPLTTGTPLVKSGAGTLILGMSGNAFTDIHFNQGAVQADGVDKLGAGELKFFGGTLKFGGVFDPSTSKALTFGLGGGAIDTNGFDITFANAIGNAGIGGLTKTGLGTLTLNAASTYTGDTVINMGTLSLGLANAISNAQLTINDGVLGLGSFDLAVSQLITGGATPVIAGTGTISSEKGFVFGHTGTLPAIDAVLAGPGGLLKLQNSTITLPAANTYTGPTEIQAGNVVVSSLGNVGSGPSSLGNPATAQDGIIRMGLTDAATTLTYTGTGHSTDRLIALQGTTGSVTLVANGTGALNLMGAKGYTGGIKTLFLGGASDLSVNNAIGRVEDGVAILSLVKNDANTWELTQANTYSGTTSINNGILRSKVTQAMTGALQFGSANSITTVGTFELLDSNASFGSLTAQTNSANSNNLVIGLDRVLNINGNVTLGSGLASSTTVLSTSGGGTLNVNNTTATGATFLVSGSSSNRATADLSGLGALNVSLNPTSGVFQVGNISTANSTGFGILTLAPATTITASALSIGGAGTYNGNAEQVNQLRLGSGTNVLNVNTVNVGTGTRDLGSITFTTTTGTVKVRAVDGVGAVDFNMGTGTSTTAADLPPGNRNTFDVSGHEADLLFHEVNIGMQNTRAGAMENLFAFNQGILVMTKLTMGSKTAAGDSTNTMNLGGGTVTIGNGLGVGPAITLAANTSSGAVSSTLNVTGGEVSVRGDILRGNQSGAGSATAKVNLDGGLLDMNSYRLGSATNPVSFVAASGTLSNLGGLNGNGILEKTGEGTLILKGVNTYTGDTQVNAGTLLVNNLTGSGTGSGNVTVNIVSTLGGMGSISGVVTVDGLISPGAMLGSDSLIGQLTVGTLTANTGSYLFLQIGGATVLDPVAVSAYQANPGSFVVPTAWTNSYAAGTTNHDQVNITTEGVQTINSSIMISGDYLEGYTPAYGDVFHFVDWASLGTNNLGGAQDFFLPTLTGAMSWNTNLFSSHGIIFVVPEPSRMLLLFFGLMGLFFRRRRH